VSGHRSYVYETAAGTDKGEQELGGEERAGVVCVEGLLGYIGV